ncbi:MAG: CPBP family intramembrane glutamic endopeptidase [Nanobdellota archaeon]
MFLALLILPLLLIILSHHFFPSSYLFSSLYKIIFLFPVAYRVFWQKKGFKPSLGLHFSWRVFKQHIWQVMGFGLLFMGVYLGVFLVVGQFLDLETIAAQLQETIALDVTNLIFIGLYIIIVNSLLEEFFWRGFLFYEMRRRMGPWLAHGLTGLGFSLHHVIFFYEWFSLPFILLATVGLIGYAIIMNLLFEKYELFSCWVIHAFADVAQILIAFRVFGVL